MSRFVKLSILTGIWVCAAAAFGLNTLQAQTAPVAENDTIAICTGAPIIIDLLANDTDADGDVLETDILSGPASPFIDYDDDGLPEGSYLIDIDPGFLGTDFILYEVCGDEDDLCAIGVLVIIVGGEEGCVWPGDANLDSICNVIDLLPIGLYFGQEGPNRGDNDGGWEETFCEDWDDVPGLELLSNPKFADCNGDGLINAADTTILMDNYGQLRGTYVPLDVVGGPDDPAITPGIFSDTLPAGTEMVLPIYFGTEDIPANEVYGMSFLIDYDETVIDAPSVYIHFNDSWLGEPGTDMLFLQKNDTVNGVVEVSVTRINQIARSGSGHFATMGFVMEDNIAGKTNGTIYTTTSICIEQPLCINNQGTILSTSIACDSFVVVDSEQSIHQIGAQQIHVYPNPADDMLVIYTEALAGAKEIRVQSATGQLITIMHTSESQIQIPTAELPAGTYMIQIISSSITHTKQCIIQH